MLKWDSIGRLLTTVRTGRSILALVLVVSVSAFVSLILFSDLSPEIKEKLVSAMFFIIGAVIVIGAFFPMFEGDDIDEGEIIQECQRRIDEANIANKKELRKNVEAACREFLSKNTKDDNS